MLSKGTSNIFNALTNFEIQSPEIVQIQFCHMRELVLFYPLMFEKSAHIQALSWESNILFSQVDLLFYRVSPLFCKEPILTANGATDLFVKYLHFKFVVAATNLKLTFYGLHIPYCLYVSCRVFSQLCPIVMIRSLLSFFWQNERLKS